MAQSDTEAQTLRLIAQLLPGQLGYDARWKIYDRRRESPMNFAIAEAERQLGQEALVVWVDGGFPELFSLAGLSQPVAVFNTRYLELSSAMRNLLFTVTMDESTLRDTARRAALKIVGELCLRAGNPDAGVRCFLEAILGGGVFADESGGIGPLDLAPRDEAYMAIWFFGLLHELGHHVSLPLGDHWLLSDDALSAVVEGCLVTWARENHLDAAALADTIRRDPSHPLGLTHLRGELIADVFATYVLARATIGIMRFQDNEAFRSERFIGEIAIYAIIVSALQRCRNAAMLLADELTAEKLERFRVQPIATMVRVAVLRDQLTALLAEYRSKELPPTREYIQQWRYAVDYRFGEFDEIVAYADAGFGDAWEFAFESEPTTSAMLARLAAALREDNVLLRHQLRHYLTQCAACHIQTPAVAELSAMIESDH